MHAFLIVGNNTQDEIEKHLKQWRIEPFDIVRITGTGIADIREFNTSLLISPYGKFKAGILEHMDALTPEAQNAFLKTLEEPPPHTYLIGTVENPETLLPTIISRMEIIRVGKMVVETGTQLLHKLLQASVGERMKLTDPYVSTADDAKNFVQTVLLEAHHELKTTSSPGLTKLIRNLFIATQQLSVNVNPRLVVDNVFLSFA